MLYAELNSLSNFSFLKAASHPEELIQAAALNNYYAIALTDECSFSGLIRAYEEAKKHQIKLIAGTLVTVDEGSTLILLANNLSAYQEISKLITLGRRRGLKGSYSLFLEDLGVLQESLVILKATAFEIDKTNLCWFKDKFKNRFWLGFGNFYEASDQDLLNKLCVAADNFNIPITAIGDVRMHTYSRRFLLDTVTAIRLKTKVDAIGNRKFSNAERYLRPLSRLKVLYTREMLAETIKIADRCNFAIEEIRCEYSLKMIPKNHSAASYLRELTEEGMKKRWPSGVPEKVEKLIDHELSLISELNYEGFFLTVENIVSFAKSKNILCQGRGSAANSAVCYCLGITEVDPSKMDMLFERFISKERDEPPDIDVDFEHERREEVIQYVYSYYGRKCAALAATVIRYKTKSAVRDVGKALGYATHDIKMLLKNEKEIKSEISEKSLKPIDITRTKFSRIDMFHLMVREITGFPRHLSQHVGGFLISDDEISNMVPIENASMVGRTVIQWDKNDLEVLGILKFDCLALGMLTAIRKSFDLLEEFEGKKYKISDVPPEDKETYSMIQKADTLGVFQIESRAQMAMLPRLKPVCFYDLVIEIAIIRPGPIQGDMVHPYLRRRKGEEEVSYPNEEVKKVLKRTLGIPLFQEQVIKLAVVAAGFSPGEAEVLRRSITSWNQDNVIENFSTKLIDGMIRKGYKRDFAESIFNQIKGFGEYGFPESHAASFALLAYISCWLKCHKQAAFTTALLNSQPMGFYSPSQLIRDAIAHNVEVRPFDITKSDWDSKLEATTAGQAAIRLGLRLIKGIEKNYVKQIVDARSKKEFKNMREFKALPFNSADRVSTLAYAGVFNSLVAGNRFYAVWEAILPSKGKMFDGDVSGEEAIPMLRPPTEPEGVLIDYKTSGFSLGSHPVKFVRDRLSSKSYKTASQLKKVSDGSVVKVVGLVISRQRPQTAAGIIFVTLEDESGLVNLIVWPSVTDAFEDILNSAKILSVIGKVQKEGLVINIVAQKLSDYTAEIGELDASSRDFK